MKYKQQKKEKLNHVHEYINYTSDWHSPWDSFKLCCHNYTHVKALSHCHRGHSVNLLRLQYLRDHDLGSTVMQIRVALVKTARFGFMKQGVQINNLPKAMNLASRNLKHSSMLPTLILLQEPAFQWLALFSYFSVPDHCNGKWPDQVTFLQSPIPPGISALWYKFRLSSHNLWIQNLAFMLLQN